MHRGLAIALFMSSVALISQTQTNTPAANSGEKPRVFVTDSQSWETQGSAGGSRDGFGAYSNGGARPQTAEIIKTFAEKCPSVTVNNLREKAAYIVVLDHEGGKSALQHKNKVAVFDAQSGDSIVSKSTFSLGGSVEEACRGIAKHWAARNPAAASASTAVDDTPATPDSGARLEAAVATSTDAVQDSAASTSAAAPTPARLSITSDPQGADIEIDGAFMGSSPSSLQLQPGDHKVVVSKKGYKPWERMLRVMGGVVSIKAELEKS